MHTWGSSIEKTNDAHTNLVQAYNSIKQQVTVYFWSLIYY
jgi:hypothetical protein